MVQDNWVSVTNRFVAGTPSNVIAFIVDRFVPDTVNKSPIFPEGVNELTPE
jgi:hypothetical protein